VKNAFAAAGVTIICGGRMPWLVMPLSEHDSSYPDQETEAAGKSLENSPGNSCDAGSARGYNRGCCEPGSVLGKTQQGMRLTGSRITWFPLFQKR
jgi:hypothetical protein